jgi:hypothetical protein
MITSLLLIGILFVLLNNISPKFVWIGNCLYIFYYNRFGKRTFIEFFDKRKFLSKN